MVEVHPKSLFLTCPQKKKIIILKFGDLGGYSKTLTRVISPPGHCPLGYLVDHSKEVNSQILPKLFQVGEKHIIGHKHAFS